MIEAIQAKIHATVEEELDRATQSKSYEQSKRHLRSVASALNHLPENMKSHFDDQLKEHQENLEKRWSDFKGKLSNLTKSPSVDAFERLTRECQEIGDKTTLIEIEDMIDKELGRIRTNISHNLSDKQIKGAIKDIQKVLDYIARLGSNYDKVHQHWLAVETAIMGETKKAYASFFVKFRNPEVSLDPQALNNSLKEFLAYAHLQSKLKEMPNQDLSLLETMYKDFSEKFEEAKRMMQTSFVETEKMYDESLAKLDVKQLAYCLALVQEWEPLIKTFGEADHSFGKELYSTKNINYQKMKLKIQEGLKQLVNKDLDMRFINDQTKDFAGTRQQYYDDLERKVKILSDAKELLSTFDPSMGTFWKDAFDAAEAQKKFLYGAACDALSKIFDAQIEGLRDKCQEFELYFNNLASAENTLSFWKNSFQSSFGKLEKSFNDKFSAYVCTIEVDVSRMDSYINGLKFIKTLSAYIQPFKAKIDTKINEILDVYKTNKAVPRPSQNWVPF